MATPERSTTRSAALRRARPSPAKSSPRPGPSVTEVPRHARPATSRRGRLSAVANERRLGGELLVLRLRRDRAVLLGVPDHSRHQREPHRGQRAFPELARGLTLFDEAPVLRRDRARIHPLGQMIDRPPGDAVRFAYRPFDGGDAAMTRQQRRMESDATQARTGERLVADARVAVRGHDQIGPFGDRIGRDQLRIVEDLDLQPGARGGQRKPVVGGRDEDTGDVDPFFEQARERGRAEVARADQGDAKFGQGVLVARLVPTAGGRALLVVVLARRVLPALPDFSASRATAWSSVSASTWSRSGSVALTPP